MDKQATGFASFRTDATDLCRSRSELHEVIFNAITTYLATTRGAHAFGAGAKVQKIGRHRMLVLAQDQETVEISVMIL